ncbi:phosphotransferase family protein [Halapricum desulfuricans]|uniref:phosphotransferase family protein n=1 Tax=Halapricum desulfuricans TaxID=2841257 RepID=UPI001E53297A|nr:phosphotransferase [Halapricum desulfuricans]
MSAPAADIEAVLEESGPDYEEFTYEQPTSGGQSDVYIVSLRHRGETYEVVVKFQPDDDATFALEPRLHEYVADRTSIPVPRILVFEPEPARDVPPYFVTERMEGESLSEQFDGLENALQTRIMTQVGTILGELHSTIAFEGFGYFGLEDDRLVVENLTWDWREFFESLTRGHLRQLESTPFDDLERPATRAIERSIDAIPTTATPRLVHDDFRPANLTFDPEAEEPITAVLDWQNALAGHPEYNVAQAELLFVDSVFRDPDTRQSLRDRLHEGYRTHHEFPAEDGYERRRPLYQLSTLLWRMGGFEHAFADADGLAEARVKAYYREQFEHLVSALPD